MSFDSTTSPSTSSLNNIDYAGDVQHFPKDAIHARPDLCLVGGNY